MREIVMTAGRGLGVVVLLTTLAFASPARADEPPDEARTAFREGAKLIEQAEWASALSSFERSYTLRPHALTLYNIGVCQRFLGRATLARETLKKALDRAQANNEMPALFLDQTRAYLAEVEAKLARLKVKVSPPDTRIAIDGLPLAPADKPGLFVAGVAGAGEPKPIGGDMFEVIVDPRPTVLTFSLEGHDTIEIKREPKPGSSEEITVSMTQQPAQIRVASNVDGSIVRVDGVDVGIAPVIVSRPPGLRVVSITADGYVPFESKLTLKPGQSLPVDGQLLPEKQSITKKWWFWVGSAALLTGVGVATYFIVRPAPERDAVQGGGLGWVATVK